MWIYDEYDDEAEKQISYEENHEIIIAKNIFYHFLNYDILKVGITSYRYLVTLGSGYQLIYVYILVSQQDY